MVRLSHGRTAWSAVALKYSAKESSTYVWSQYKLRIANKNQKYTYFGLKNV